MKKSILFVALGFLVVSGCADPYAKCKLGPARDVVAGSIDAMGGLGRWKSVGSVNATSVVVIYDDDGRGMVFDLRQYINLAKDVILAKAGESWSMTVHGNGKFLFWPGQRPISLKREMIAHSLQTILHRVRGPVNLCGGGEKAIGSERVRIDGKDMIRVSVKGGDKGVKAYYFDAQTHALKMITAGADEAGADGTVTVYTWKMHPNGMAFPDKISVMKIGKNVLVGDTPVLEVEYRKVEW